MAAAMAPKYCSDSVGKPVRRSRVRKMGEKAPPSVYKRYICSFPDCSASYNKNWKLQAHLCKHTGERPFPCTHEGCGKGFVTMFHLTRHTMTHTGEKPFKCDSPDCELSFSTMSNMRKHYQRAHQTPSLLYVCYFADCGKSFKKHNQLKIHQYIHTNQQPFKCTHEGCDKSFLSPSRLKRHEKVHAGYPCQKDSTCPFVGKTWTEYMKHVAADHTEPSICDVCNRTFKRKTHLKEHKKTHEVEIVVYRCPREGCDRTYTKKFGLQNHILSFHEELRPFSCEHPGCGKTFAMKQSLDRHANTHDPEKKKMKKSRPKRSLASRLSGYNPKKSTKTSSQEAEVTKTSSQGAEVTKTSNQEAEVGELPPDPSTAMENLSIK
ncbi:transcription factor IIIA isoform X2 [Pyxicephalus adspersus]|uniref:transcription factor IIIA isoform X2 n=1 Tax=Pyxicephalus adspersus TaxID=30357 RepID=UPI003B598CCE